ncbi:MAG TPA: hypothetical protein VGI56_13155 [Galbitalea sp.]|jgi:hypothetical protein
MAETVYTGTISDAVEGTGSIDALISTSGESVGGTWDESFTGQKPTTRFINGTLNGSSYSATVSDCVPGSSQPCTSTCRLTFSGSLTSGMMSGSYAEAPDASCPTARHGTIDTTTR